MEKQNKTKCYVWAGHLLRLAILGKAHFSPSAMLLKPALRLRARWVCSCLPHPYRVGFPMSKSHTQINTIWRNCSEEEARAQVAMEMGRLTSTVLVTSAEADFSKWQLGLQGRAGKLVLAVPALHLARGWVKNYCFQFRQSINLHKPELSFK